MEKNCLIWMPNTKCSFILRVDHWSSSAILETHDLPFSNRTMGRSRSPIIAPGRAKHNGRDSFNQTFRKFRSKSEWIGSVQPEKFRKNRYTFRSGPLFSVGPVRSKWAIPTHSQFQDLAVRYLPCTKWRKILITAHLWIVNSRSIGVTRTVTTGP